jgi:hypothetical protein
MSVSDGGSPFAAQQNAGPTSPPSGTWTVTVRSTGTASSGTTRIQLSMGYTSSHLQPASGSGWSCDTTSYGARPAPTPPRCPRAGRFRAPAPRARPLSPTPGAASTHGPGRAGLTARPPWTVTLPADSQLAPSKANLPAQADPSYRSQNIVSQFFGLGPDSSVVQMTASIWTYPGRPGRPGRRHAADLPVTG